VKRFRSRKAVAILVAGAIALGGAGAALAYFTSTGNGSGTGTVGTATSWTVAGGSVDGTLYPDASAAAGPDYGVVTGASVTNPATAHGNQNLNTIVATISGVTSTPVGSEDACSVSDFQFYSPTATWSGSGTQTATINPNDDLAPGASYNISDLDVVMVDNGAPQDDCQGSTVTVSFAAS
jgi:hypothetical protein